MDIRAYKDKDIEILTERQKQVFILLQDGKTSAEIAEIIGCSRQNIYGLIKFLTERLDRGIKTENYPKKQKSVSQKCFKGSNKIDYSRYAEKNLEILTNREREIFLLRLELGSNKEVADKLGISPNTISVILMKVRDRLDGKELYSQKYYKKYKEKRKERMKQNPEKCAEARRKCYLKHREDRIAKMKKYNQEYYRKNREKILEKQRQDRLKEKEGAQK